MDEKLHKYNRMQEIIVHQHRDVKTIRFFCNLPLDTLDDLVLMYSFARECYLSQRLHVVDGIDTQISNLFLSIFIAIFSVIFRSMCNN